MSKHDPHAGLCKTHRHYAMDCATFDALWTRAAGRCEICREPPRRTLHIDHDSHVGHWGVRGLLCTRCNTTLHRMPPSRTAAYLADPWWQHILAACGVPASGIPEPGIGAIVAVSHVLRWQRTPHGWERLTNLHRELGRIEPWSLIATYYGPHRVKVLSSPDAMESAPCSSRALVRA